MSGQKKILTVSYGTFSCTLEGFDDPINTLQQVTAHFQKLTTADPGFGTGAVPALSPAPPEDAAVDRLIRTSDTHMSEPENKRRQSAIQHLKAAVAGRVATRLEAAPPAPAPPRADPAPISTGFASFADHLTAETPPELIEAAAVWTFCVENRPTFTRQQVLRHVASLGSLTHEVMMQAFETLVREAILEKQERGRFALTARSLYLREVRG
ncbi:hypothetical protein [Falsirhodobacter halotolerans]|uniref:hypothetical protein n=1 Tax=Falsirhodobacter halotolerans TaxID=1146892 RepID=UPI001FD3D941|nr:hypothetical protein [Falsirhodobacter halotolerans]MCJ8139925.1 hypothetical protein [Falsirhodobacter halotolerans]